MAGPFVQQPFAGGVTQPPSDLDLYQGGQPRPVTQQSLLVDEVMRRIRRSQITAAPPANVRPTVWSMPIDLSTQVTVLAVVNPLYTVGLRFVVPKGYAARIEQYGLNFTNPAYTYNGTVLFGFRKNGQQMLGNGMSDWGEQRGSMVYPRKVAITLQANEVLEFMYRRALAPGPAYQVQMGFRGWMFPMRNTYLGTQAVATAY